MSELWLVQYLCPKRHCLVASPYERPTQTAEGVEAALLAEMTRLGLLPRCGLCGSHDVYFEHAKLADQNWDTALEKLLHNERAQILSRAAIELAKGNTN